MISTNLKVEAEIFVEYNLRIFITTIKVSDVYNTTSLIRQNQ